MDKLKFRYWNVGKRRMEYFDFFTADCYAMCENIEQFTGLKDKNGKEIYEGTILGIPKYPNHISYASGLFPAKVIFKDGMFMLKGKHETVPLKEIYNPALYQPAIGKGTNTIVEIIGNIHEIKNENTQNNT